eukprot:scaffold139952_cov30-Tisochrysis_lutea.AAC.1
MNENQPRSISSWRLPLFDRHHPLSPECAVVRASSRFVCEHRPQTGAGASKFEGGRGRAGEDERIQ